jgi:hypothetical protein
MADTNELVVILRHSIDRFNNSIDRETLLCSTDPELDRQVSKFRVAHEQAITHRLAFYLECNLRRAEIIQDKSPIVLDCEYNQHLFDKKKLRVLIKDAGAFLRANRAPIPVEGRTDLVEFEVRPDVVVHRRGIDGPTNIMLLEIKRWTNPDRQHDELKLRLFTETGENQFGYQLGAAVYARNDRAPEKRVLEIGCGFTGGERML